jgi:hypothetical protein
MQISISFVAIQFDLFLIGGELLWTLVVWAGNMKKMVTYHVLLFFNVGIHLKFSWLSLSSPHLAKQNAFSFELKKAVVEAASPGSHKH